MSIIELRHNDCFSKRCRYNMQTNQYTFFTKSNVSSHDLGNGVFTTLNGNFYAISKSYKGPIFIYNNRYFILGNVNYTFKHCEIPHGEKSKNDKCHFTFTVDGNVIIDIIYDKPIGWCEWGDDLLDFFNWLSAGSMSTGSDSHFFEVYTDNNIKV